MDSIKVILQHKTTKLDCSEQKSVVGSTATSTENSKVCGFVDSCKGSCSSVINYFESSEVAGHSGYTFSYFHKIII